MERLMLFIGTNAREVEDEDGALGVEKSCPLQDCIYSIAQWRCDSLLCPCERLGQIKERVRR